MKSNQNAPYWSWLYICLKIPSITNQHSELSTEYNCQGRKILFWIVGFVSQHVKTVSWHVDILTSRQDNSKQVKTNSRFSSTALVTLPQLRGSVASMISNSGKTNFYRLTCPYLDVWYNSLKILNDSTIVIYFAILIHVFV